MLLLTGKNLVVIGGSRGVGRRIVEAAARNGARVLAVARKEGPLTQLAQEVSGTEVLSLDATDEGAPSKVFDVLLPDILVLCGGAFPPVAPPPARARHCGYRLLQSAFLPLGSRRSLPWSCLSMEASCPPPYTCPSNL